LKQHETTMVHQELLQDLTESYLKSLISEVSVSLRPDFDSLAAFGELGIDSFHVLKIVRRLEADFGTLSKSLLFENFNIVDLAKYFVAGHGQTLAAMFSDQLRRPQQPAGGGDRQLEQSGFPAEVRSPAARPPATVREAGPIRILEKDAYETPELRELVRTLFARYKSEGCVSRGTRKIAPNLFIGSARKGYFNYGRSRNLILVYGYAGPEDYLPTLLEEIHRHCEAHDLQLNVLGGDERPTIGEVPLTATPFGAMQRIVNLKEFTLEGGAMRRLRYQVSKFQKSGACRTEEYRCGTDAATERNIAAVIDRWCEARPMVNPLVHDVRAEVLGGTLAPEHRIFLTYLDDVLQNVIIITAMSAEANGYLMDMEFYPLDMPLGGLEFAIVQIIERLVAEGCDMLSLGGTYGCKLDSSANADPDIDRLLDDLRAQGIFNDQGNLQFKNKFRPETAPIYLCRPVGSGTPDSVIDIIMMIADPDKAQTSDEDNHNFIRSRSEVAAFFEKPAVRHPPVGLDEAGSGQLAIGGEERSRSLSEFGFNPMTMPHERIELDLKTDSWAQLEIPAIQAQMRHLHGQLQQPVSVDETLRAVFPFAHFVLTAAGQSAEHIFFKAWPRQGVVLQNLLFPSTIFHQIDKGFTPRELPHAEVFHLTSQEPYKGNMAWEALQAEVAQDPGAIAFVCIEVADNAAGGASVSMQHLRDVKALLAGHSIPLVIDGTRILENAQFLVDEEKEFAGKSMWAVAREMFSQADAVIGSLTKDFCVNKGGIIATNDARLFQRLQDVVQAEGAGIDLIDRKLIALSLQNRKQIEARVLQRMENVRLVGRALGEHGIPIVHPAGGHCILIDVKQVPEFKDLNHPVASFVAWLYLNTGIRAGAHSVGMQKRTAINDLVRLAIPVGLKRDGVEELIARVVGAFDAKANIPQLVLESSRPPATGVVYATYELAGYQNPSGSVVAKSHSASGSAGEATPAAAFDTMTASSTSARVASSPLTVTPQEAAPEQLPGAIGSARTAGTARPRRTQDVAIVGMAGRYPKAKNAAQLWANLAAGLDCIDDIPADRHEQRLLHGSSEKYRGGFIDDVDKFDSLFFNISPREAEMLDPQERLFLEVAWEAIEDAGYYPETLARDEASRNVGVYVGAVWAMYQMLGVEEKHAGNKMAPNSFLWSIANRVSYSLNLCGPSLTIDTACSSSLTAIYLACEAITAGECSAAIVGGVNLDLHQAKLDINRVGNALSVDGVCRSFGKGANGYVAGEGIGALVLKPLDQAEADGDQIYGVIRSAVVNHGGRTAGYTVPNPKAQTNLILSACEKANVGARSIGYIEAHGTGTELGDPIEISGLRGAFSAHEVENQTCAVGSIKSNIGHLEAAAGIVGVSKVLLQMKHRQLAPSLHSSELNEFIDFEHSPFYVPQCLEEWKAKEIDGLPLPLRAGISSFGAGGANAHVILDSYEPIRQSTEEPAQATELIFPLSARSEDQLREAAVRLAAFLREKPVDLHDAAYTLQQGRKSFEQRLAIVATTREELLEKLASFIDGKKADHVAVGQAKAAEGLTRLLNRREKQEFIHLLSQSGDPHKIATMWAEGLLSDWQGFQSRGSARRVSLPTYPFADKRHWAGHPAAVRAPLQPVAGVHPMVDSNESTFERQLFKKTFHERDFFIYDHHVADIPTLPGVAYLELARKAGEIAAGRPVRRIQNILWVSPIAVENSVPKEVFIELKPSGEAVQFEVFSHGAEGRKTLHSQGKLLYTARPDAAADREYVDLDAIRARCATRVDGKSAYPLFRSVGLNLGPSFQVLQEIHKSDTEVLGVLKLPEFRQGDLHSMVLHPSLVDGSLQAGMAARLGDSVGEMMVPYSIGEVEILHPLQSLCFSYTTEAEGKKGSRVLKSNVLILDEAGKILARIRESTGVPLVNVHKSPENEADAGYSKLYYSYEWEKAPLVAQAHSPSPASSILLFDTSETFRELYRARLRDEGTTDTEIILVGPAEGFRKIDGCSYEIDPRSKDDFTRLFESLAEKSRSIEEICFAWPIAHPDFRDQALLKESVAQGVSSFLFLCQAVIQSKLEGKVQLLYLHSGRPGEAQPQHEAMGGFVKTLQGEYPKLLCKTLEIRREEDGYGQVLDAVWAEFGARTQDATVVRYVAQERHTRKLKAFDLLEQEDAIPSEAITLKEAGVYLITGGAGGLGFIFADYLAKEYRARLVLSGRSALPAGRQARLDELRNRGTEVHYVVADVSSLEDVRNLIGECKSRFGEINGVIHSAGVVRDSYVRNKTPEEMSAVFAPKVHGTLHLDEETRSEALDFFVMFSSLAALTGNVGQCDYSFANHFMDSFAVERERLRAAGQRSGKTLSINWSLWAGGGMKPDEQTELLLRKTMGMKPLSAATGLEAFVLGLASGRTQFAVLEGVQEKLDLALGGRKKDAAPAVPPASGHAPLTTVADQEEGGLRGRLQEDLSQIVMEFLKLDPADMSADKILLDLGFDSIGLTTFANAVNEKYQLDITPILFFDYPSIGEIAKHLADERKTELRRFYGGFAASTQSATAQAAQPRAKSGDAGHDVDGDVDHDQAARFTTKKRWAPAASDRHVEPLASSQISSPELRFVNEPIAIVGMSGVMPQSDDLDEFWENLKSSKDMVTVIPADRWRWEDYYGDPFKEPNTSNSKWGGFMREIDKFDSLFFGISPREAQMMDPQQRIFLEHVWKAVEDSGHKVSDLSGTRTGLFLGVGTTDYANLLSSRNVALDGYTASGNSHSVTANRVSFLLNLRGPSAPIDTACSSSLVAFHRAIESIHSGSCDMAIVGGVQVMLSPAAYISFGMAGMLSGDGKCKTFDKQANGYVRGEGCGAVFLKPLSAAEADGNHVYAVIKATAENHGGRVTTMTAPNSVAQTDLLIEAYEKARIDPTTVGYIECHGTGTVLGDPIEIQALGKAFSELYRRNNKPPAATPHCGLSSVKTNIGHLETGAGIAGVLKALLAIKHRQIPANLHLQELNPYINLAGTPFYIADKLTPWRAPIGADGLPAPRRAGVSSFGFGGANAHVVLEEYIVPPRPSPAAEAKPRLIVLSAKNEDRLQAYIQSMSAYLETHEVELLDFAYTLQVGRDEMPERLALVVSSAQELRQKFAAILEGENPADSYRSNIKSGRAKATTADAAAGEILVRGLIERNGLSGLAELWVAGAKIDWRLLYEPGAPRRVSAPTYPFARERHWMPDPAGTVAEKRHQPAAVAAPRLHPLIHRNVSTLREQKFESRFTGTEFYLADHRVKTEAVLPAVAYIEMAAAAGQLAGERDVRFIRDMTWLAPISVGYDARDIEVSLSPGKNEFGFAVRSVNDGKAVTHCRGKLAYLGTVSEPGALDVAGIQERCSDETLAGTELYPFLCTSELNLGKSFQVVQQVRAGRGECLAVLQLPAHLKGEADEFHLHPALLDGALHTAIGIVKRRNPARPWTVPSSAGEIQILRPLKDAYYAHAAWDPGAISDEKSLVKIQLHLLDRDGQVLVRIKDFIAKPYVQAAAQIVPVAEAGQAEPLLRETETRTALQALRPIWSSARFGKRNENRLAESGRILLLGGDQIQLDWVRESSPGAQRLEIASTSGIEVIGNAILGSSFDQLLWVAPDAGRDALSQSEGTEHLIDQQEQGVLAIFRIVKGLLLAGYGSRKVQWTIITSGTQRITGGDPTKPAHAGIVGFVGSLAKEYPQWDLRLLDLDSLASVPAAECLSLPWDKQGNALAHRRGEWFEQGLELMATLPQTTPLYRRGGVYVVIGGAGGVGEVWSRFMIEQYQAHIVWIGRRDCDAAIEQKMNSLSELGPAPSYLCADATDMPALARARSRVLETHPSIHGVVHSAIVLQDQSIARMDESVFRMSLAAKVDISVNMDRVFGRNELDFMLFFSSIISFFKSPGQSNYSAGCSFKDSFAQTLQRERTYPVKIMNWGYWGSVGVVADESHSRIMARLGMGSIEPTEGMASLQALLSSDVSQIALIKTLNGDAPVGPSLSEAMAVHLAKKTQPKAPVDLMHAEMKTTVGAAGNSLKQTGSSPTAERTEQMTNEHVRRIITEKLSDALRMDAAGIRNDSPFADYGVDSIVGVNFVRTISEALQIELEATSLFEYSTVDQLSQYIVSNWQTRIAAHLAPAGAVSAAAANGVPGRVDSPSEHRFRGPAPFDGPDAVDLSERDERSSGSGPIAIIGMSGRFAESEFLEAFWQNLKEGKDLVKKVSRWSAADCVTSAFAGQAYCSSGSFIDTADQFDPTLFGISSQEATYMDPQQRLLLEESWRALEDAGYGGKSAHEKQCGVYVGCGTSNYGDLFGPEPPAQAWWGNSQSVAPARIAYHLNLQGPAIAVDTACSSALVAIHLACQSLWSGETEMALAGGVYLQATSGFHQVANRAGMLSPLGKCRSFDARADGFVPGEAVGVVVLKPLRDAVRDGDHVHAVISGSGINQNGSSNGLIAPNVRAQERLERSVYERFGIDPGTIQVVEAHGTATIIGDSIEHLALSRAFREHTDKKQFCAIGSVKANIGHAGNAAGIASVLKLVLSLEHRQIVPSVHFEKANPAIDFGPSPFYINDRLQEWQVDSGQLRRGAVSSFGFSGTNAHLVIEEAPSIERASAESPGYVVVLSARTAEQLKQQVHNLLAFLERTPDVPMNDLSFTLFVGRMHLSNRLSCVARGQEELSQRLRQWLETGAASQVQIGALPEGRVREQAALKKFGNYCIEECRRSTDEVSRLENLEAIADLYVQGYSLDFPALFSTESRRIPLPTYPFARERYWVDDLRVAVPASTARPAARQEGVADEGRSIEAAWLFSRDPAFVADGVPVYGDPMDALAKMELFLRQETALQLQKPIADVPTHVSYFDLGLTSLAIAHLIQNMNRLLAEDLSPSALFEYTDIRSLAGYLAQTYPAKLDAVRVVRRGGGQNGPAEHVGLAAAKPTPLSGKQNLSADAGESTAATSAVPDPIRARMLEQVLWQEASLDDSYEKVTF